MKNILLFCLLLGIPVIGLAHPGIGIVRDSKGNIFYTDLKQVWKIGIDGRKTIAVPNVHSHELFLDANDDLYGEHLWYNGERLNTWGHFVWRLHANGKLDTVINPTQGFLENYSFVRDAKGNMYWVERFKVSKFKKKTPEGSVQTIAEGKFKDIRWMHATATGALYFMDLVDLYLIEPGQPAKLVAEDISSSTNLFAPFTDSKHDIMGIWTDKEDNIFVANFSGQVVKKISIEGTVTKIAFSTAPWSPTGGLFDEKGNLWLLEYSVTNEARVRKIIANDLGKEGNMALRQLNNNILPPILLIGGAGITLLLIGIAIKTIKTKVVG